MRTSASRSGSDALLLRLTIPAMPHMRFLLSLCRASRGHLVLSQHGQILSQSGRGEESAGSLRPRGSGYLDVIADHVRQAPTRSLRDTNAVVRHGFGERGHELYGNRFAKND